MALWTITTNTIHISRLRKKLLLTGLLLMITALMYKLSATLNRSLMNQRSVDIYNGPMHQYIDENLKDPILEETVEFIPGRKRTLETLHGTIQVIDIAFTARPTLRTDQSVYDKKNTKVKGAQQRSAVSQRLNDLQRKYQFVVPSKDRLKSANVPASKLNTPSTHSQCLKPHCTEYLTQADQSHFNFCTKKANISKDEIQSSVCRFMNGTDRHPIALASYPGSGNTWVRGLLQEVTGLCTGGVYCDTTLRQNGFLGEEIRSGVVLVVKTHQTNPQWPGVQTIKEFTNPQGSPLYQSAILLIRNPLDAILEVWTKKSNEEQEDWEDFVFTQINQWQQTLLGWLTTAKENHPILVI